MSSHWKLARTILLCLLLLLGGFWISVQFLGESWSDQARYALTLLNLLFVILLGAVVLLGIFKVAALLWEKVVDRAAGNNADDHSKQE